MDKIRGPKPKSQCKHGHEFTPENTIQLFNKNGSKNGRLCRTCKQRNARACYARNPEKYTQLAKDYRQEHLDVLKSAALKRKYGIALEDYNEMLLNQDGKCALCGADDPGRRNAMFSVDHCHGTGEIRKLLCSMCNLALGAAKDNPTLLRKMADYIESYREIK